MSPFRRWALLFLLSCLPVALALPAGAQETAQFRTYRDVAGFSCEFPAGWSFDQSTKGDRVFSGPGEDLADVTIIIQVIDRELTAEKSAAAQLTALKEQLQDLGKARILTEGTAPIAEQQAPFLIAAYETTDTAGRLRPFRHIQSVVTAPEVFLLMSYSAPDEIFDENMRVFQHCSATLAVGLETASPAAPPPAPAAPGEALLWKHNTDRAFWIAVPANWSSDTDDAPELYTLNMRHPDRVEGVIVWVLDMPRTMKVKEFADSWEENLSGMVFFMKDRLAVTPMEHPGVGLPGASVVVRHYQGQESGATVQSVVAFVVNKRRAYTVVGYHFLGDTEGASRTRDAVRSFRLASPDG